jgi:ligand-binding sensor domain-containing protein
VAVTAAGITALVSGRDGGIWVAGNGRLRHRRADGTTIDLGSYPWNKGSSIAAISVMCEDRSGGLWAGTVTNGVLRRTKDGTWSHVANSGPLFQNVISSITEDREGSIWIGTETGGLHRLKRRAVTALALPTAASDANAQSVCAAHDGSVWIATGGAGRFATKTGCFRTLRRPKDSRDCM